MKEIEIDGEKIYINKSKFGYRVVHPIKKDQSKGYNKENIDWKNLISGGNWANLLFIIIFVILAIGSIIEYNTALDTANECLIKLKNLELIP